MLHTVAASPHPRILRLSDLPAWRGSFDSLERTGRGDALVGALVTRRSKKPDPFTTVFGWRSEMLPKLTTKSPKTPANQSRRADSNRGPLHYE
jgi:hypothetical protein